MLIVLISTPQSYLGMFLDWPLANEILAEQCSFVAGHSKCFCLGEKSTGLEAGPIVGIVVGALVVTSILVLASIWTFLTVRKRRRLSGKYSPSDTEGISGRSAPLPLPPTYEGLM